MLLSKRRTYKTSPKSTTHPPPPKKYINLNLIFPQIWNRWYRGEKYKRIVSTERKTKSDLDCPMGWEGDFARRCQKGGEECLRVRDPLTSLWSRHRTEVACVPGGRRNRGPGCPWTKEESGRTRGTLLPTSARLPPVPGLVELLKVTNCFHY